MKNNSEFIKFSALYMSLCQHSVKHKGMKNGLDMKSIFRCMMEDGYYPTYEKTHILFEIDDNTAVVEYEERVLSIRLFFSIEEDAYDLFLEACNATMTETFLVKSAVLEDMKNIMFSCEILCDTVKEFRRFFPRGVERLTEAVLMHKAEMKKLIIAEKVSSATISAAEDTYIMSSKGAKPLS